MMMKNYNDVNTFIEEALKRNCIVKTYYNTIEIDDLISFHKYQKDKEFIQIITPDGSFEIEINDEEESLMFEILIKKCGRCETDNAIKYLNNFFKDSREKDINDLDDNE